MTLERDLCIITSIAWHLFTVVINILHLIVLCTMPEFKTRSFGKVIIGITIADIYLSAETEVSTSTDLFVNKEENWGWVAEATVQGIRMAAIHTNYYACAVSCLERCLALCFPFKHRTSCLIANMGKIMIIGAVVLNLFDIGSYISKSRYDTATARDLN